MAKRLLILGGYGNTGRLIAEYLVQETDVALVLAGRSLEKASVLAAELDSRCEVPRVAGIRLDASDAQALEAAFSKVDLVVVAASSMDHVAQVAKAALQTGTDYVDTQLSAPPKLDALEARREAMTQRGCCFITDCGFHPGVPAALVRYAATRVDRLERADVASLMRIDWGSRSFSESTVAEFAEEIMRFNPTALREGRWVRTKMRNLPQFDFGAPFGASYCVPMFMEELRPLPEQVSSLQETGFYVAGFHPITDYLVMPLAAAGIRLFGRRAAPLMGRMLFWSLRTFSKPPYRTVLKLEASGIRHGKPVSFSLMLSHEDAYVLTAVPVVACLLQYLEGQLPETGLWTQANIVEPERFLRDIGRMGIRLEPPLSMLAV